MAICSACVAELRVELDYIANGESATRPCWPYFQDAAWLPVSSVSGSLVALWLVWRLTAELNIC